MTKTSTAAKTADTAAAKKEIREALKFAGFQFFTVSANAHAIQVMADTDTDAAEILKMYPDARGSEYDARVVYIPR